MLEIYEKSVTELRNEMIELGIKVEQAVDNAWKALEHKDIELANRIYNGDDEIDAMVKDCMKKDLTISMMQGPVPRPDGYVENPFRSGTDSRSLCRYQPLCHSSGKNAS